MIRVKLVLIMLLLGVSSLEANVWSQVVRVSLDFDNVNMADLFETLQKETHLNFVYNLEDVSSFTVNAKVQDKSVSQVLDIVLAGKPLKYEIIDDYVVISKTSAPRSQQTGAVTLTGTVRDERGNPLIGAHVVLANTAIGTSTDAEGRFSLKIPSASGTLEVGFLGMESRQVAIVAGKTQYDVVLKPNATEVDEVLVTGYFDRSKSNFTGSVTTVKREELRQYGNTNIFNILSIVDPGLTINENNEAGSNPNQLPDFVIRGEGSFLGNSNTPTFIVDGFEVSMQYIFDMDLERIESINILKDASATSLYGSRAANGVVVIETRRPGPGELKVEYTARLTLNAPDLTSYNLMNAEEKLRFEELSGVWKAGSDANQHLYDKLHEGVRSDILRGVDTYWPSKPLRTALSHQHSLYVSGGDRAVTYGVGANYNRNNGVMKLSSRETYGFTFDLTYRIRDKVVVRNSFNYGNTHSENSPYGSFQDYTSANPYSPIYDDNGVFIPYYTQHYSVRHANPLYNASLVHRDFSSVGTITDNLSIDYRILPQLRFKASAALSKNTTLGERFKSPLHSDFAKQSVIERGEVMAQRGAGWNYNINATLAFDKAYDKHYIYVGGGLNVMESKSSADSYRVIGFLDERFNDIDFALQYAKDQSKRANSSENRSRMIGFIGTANYTYDNRYFIDFSGRYEGSSKYGADQRFGFFWSAGAGWNIHNESFLKGKVAWLEELRLRANIGQTGNNSFDPYMARTMLRFYSSQVYYEDIGVYSIAYGNPDLKWQKNMQTGVGLDLMMVERRLSLGVDYYRNLTNGLLLPVTVPRSFGFGSYTDNFGEILNTGFEVNLSGVIVRTKDWDWAVSVRGAHNTSEIRKISDALRSSNDEANSDPANATKPITTYEEGESMTAIKVVRSLGINPETGRELYINRFGEITEVWDPRDKVVMGDSNPKWRGTISTNLMWRHWTLTAALQYGVGGQKYNQTLVSRVEGLNPKSNGDRRALDERWQKPGDRTFYKDVADRNLSRLSSRFVQDDNYLRLSNVSLFYRFDSKLISKWGISNLRVGVNMADVFYLQTIKRERGLDYPFARQFTFNLNLYF